MAGVKLAGATGWMPADRDLRGAKLAGADLRDADLSGADLRDADLSGAGLAAACYFCAACVALPKSFQWGSRLTASLSAASLCHRTDPFTTYARGGGASWG